MVTIKEETYLNPLFSGPLSDYTLYLYQIFSEDPLPSEVGIPNDSWKPFINMLYDHNEQEHPVYTEFGTIPVKTIEEDQNKVILALSGGKDSTASLLRLIDEGRDVTAYFCKKANLSYSAEEGVAENIANIYNVPMVKDELHRSGKTDFVENPVKNMVFLARMIEWGFKNNCTRVQLGEYWNTGNDEVNVKYDMSDSIDFLIEYEKAVQSHYPQVKFDIMFECEATAVAYLVDKHPEVLRNICSCLMPSRYFNRQLRMVLDKFPNLKANPDQNGFEGDLDQVMPNRCMKCWKCNMEWVYLVLMNVLPYDKDFMENNVLPVFIKKMPEIDRKWSDEVDVSKASTQDILDHVVELEKLRLYVTDKSLIYQDIRHRYPYNI